VTRNRACKGPGTPYPSGRSNLLARTVAAFGLLAALASSGCSHRDACNVIPDPPTEAIFEPSCGVANLVAVDLSGPCATGDAGLSSYVSGESVAIASPSPGVCHVRLAFATGFTYSADVTFTSQATVADCVPSVSYVGPTQVDFPVTEPGGTCMASGDACASCADAGKDVTVSTEPADDAETGAPDGAACDVPAALDSGLAFAWDVRDSGSTPAICQAALAAGCCSPLLACAGDEACAQLVACVNACPTPRADGCVNTCNSSASSAAQGQLSAVASCSKDAPIPCQWP
jgi:hypothetical protein